MLWSRSQQFWFNCFGVIPRLLIWFFCSPSWSPYDFSVQPGLKISNSSFLSWRWLYRDFGSLNNWPQIKVIQWIIGHCVCTQAQGSPLEQDLGCSTLDWTYREEPQSLCLWTWIWIYYLNSAKHTLGLWTIRAIQKHLWCLSLLSRYSPERCLTASRPTEKNVMQEPNCILHFFRIFLDSTKSKCLNYIALTLSLSFLKTKFNRNLSVPKSFQVPRTMRDLAWQ